MPNRSTYTHTRTQKHYPIPKALSPYQKKTFCILLSSDQSALSSHSKYGEEMNEIPLEANFNWINRSFYHLGVLQLLKLAWCLVALKFRKARSSYLFCSLMDPFNTKPFVWNLFLYWYLIYSSAPRVGLTYVNKYMLKNDWVKGIQWDD